MDRRLSFSDRLLADAQNALGTVFGRPPAERANPAGDTAEVVLDDVERRHAAGLMRINHVGEVCAQALYVGQASVARDPVTRAALLAAAAEETDHLAWCAERLRADFADVVDAHQSGGVAPFVFIENDVGFTQAGIGAFGARCAEHCLQCVLRIDEQAVERSEVACGMRGQVFHGSRHSARNSRGCCTGSRVPFAKCSRQPMLALSRRVAPLPSDCSSSGRR